jgi:uncharacterized protein DUF1769
MDRPIRDRLPPGFSYALRIVKWWIDPALDGDPYADKPYLYSPGLATWNHFRIGDRVDRNQVREVRSLHSEVVEEGADGTGREVRNKLQIPDEFDLRKKHFLDEENRKKFVFEAGRVYLVDFGNPYLGFSGRSASIALLFFLFSFLSFNVLYVVFKYLKLTVLSLCRFLSSPPRVQPTSYQIYR